MRELFLAAIAANPNDPHTRLVYADWLDENGKAVEALAYRLSVEPPYQWPEHFEQASGWPFGTIDRVGGYPRPFYRGDDLALAREFIEWVEANRAKLDQVANAITREQVWLSRAEAGDVNAILAHRHTREAVLAGGIMRYTRRRVAVAKAKAVLLARQARRWDRLQAEAARTGTPGRIRRLWIEKLRKRAFQLAYEYHRNTHPLYRSKRATIVYGRGGQEDAGAYLDSELAPRFVIIENYRGIEVARIPL